MSFRPTVLAIVCCMSLMPATHAIAATVPPASHAAHAAAVPVPAQRWTPDGPLREGMRRARAAVDNLHRYETGQVDATEAARQAAEVEAAVVYMFSNCKLAAEPDEALHGILVPLLGAAQALKADPNKLDAIATMRAAIAQYPRYFDDPGWVQLEPAAAHS